MSTVIFITSNLFVPVMCVTFQSFASMCIIGVIVGVLFTPVSTMAHVNTVDCVDVDLLQRALTVEMIPRHILLMSLPQLFGE